MLALARRQTRHRTLTAFGNGRSSRTLPASSRSTRTTTLASKMAPGKTDIIIQGYESDVPSGTCGHQTGYGLPWSEYCIAPIGHDPDHSL